MFCSLISVWFIKNMLIGNISPVLSCPAHYLVYGTWNEMVKKDDKKIASQTKHTSFWLREMYSLYFLCFKIKLIYLFDKPAIPHMLAKCCYTSNRHRAKLPLMLTYVSTNLTSISLNIHPPSTLWKKKICLAVPLSLPSEQVRQCKMF